MNRTTHIQPIPAMSLIAQGLESCVSIGFKGFVQQASARVDVAAKK